MQNNNTEFNGDLATSNQVVSPGFNLIKGVPYLCRGKQIISQNNTISAISTCNYEIQTLDPKDSLHMFNNFYDLMPSLTPLLLTTSMLAGIKPLLVYLGYVPSMVYALVAPSGHLKTSLVHKFCMELNDFDIQFMSFASRLNTDKLEKKLKMLEGLCFLVDDVHEQHSSYAKNAIKDKLDRVIHLGSDIEHGATVFITAESLNNLLIFSALDRIVEIHIPCMSGNELQILKNSLARLNPLHLNYIKKQFIQVLLNNYSEVEQHIKSFFLNIIFNEKYDLTLRLSRHHSFVKLTNELIWKYLFPNQKELSKTFSDHLDQILNENKIRQEKLLIGSKSNSCDYVVEFYQMLQKEYLHMQNTDVFGKINFNKSYYSHNNKYYITSTAIIMGMSEYLGRYVPFMDVISALDSAGLLVHDSENKRSVHIPGISTKKRAYCINVDLLNTYLSYQGIDINNNNTVPLKKGRRRGLRW